MTDPTADRLREILRAHDEGTIDRDDVIDDCRIIAAEQTRRADEATADAVRMDAERHVDDLAIRALETVLEVEALGRATAHLIDDDLDTAEDGWATIQARDRVPVQTLRRALTAVDELGRYAHLTRKRAALGPLRNDPDARIRSLESVLRRVLVNLDRAAQLAATVRRSLDGEPIDTPLDDLTEILGRTFGLARAAAPGPVNVDGPYSFASTPSVAELDEAARHLDTILDLRFAPADGRTFPDEIRDEIRQTRSAAMHAAMALARLGANVHPADDPAAWDHLDDLAAMLDRALDPDHGAARDNSVVGAILERARHLVAQAGGDPTRWTAPGDDGNASGPHE